MWCLNLFFIFTIIQKSADDIITVPTNKKMLVIIHFIFGKYSTIIAEENIAKINPTEYKTTIVKKERISVITLDTFIIITPPNQIGN